MIDIPQDLYNRLTASGETVENLELVELVKKALQDEFKIGVEHSIAYDDIDRIYKDGFHSGRAQKEKEIQNSLEDLVKAIKAKDFSHSSVLINRLLKDSTIFILKEDFYQSQSFE